MLDTGTWTRRGTRIVIDLGPPEANELELELELGAAQPTLRRGSRGSTVADLQSSLRARGFDPGPLDGIFGPNTETAVRSFQASRGISVDGVVGASTWNALRAASTPAPAPAEPYPSGSRRPVRVEVPFYGYQSNDPAGCFNRCKDMARAVGVTVGGPDVRIQIGLSEDRAGRVRIDAAKAREGTAYIDSQLDAGRPVCVGVSYKDAAYNVDAITDHFVLVTTRGVDPRKGIYYAYHDPATSDAYLGTDRNPANRFYLSSAGGLYRPPSTQKPRTGDTYDVTMVRRNV